MLLASAAALAQTGGAARRADPAAVQALVLEELARIDWIEKSDVAALREGVIERIELQIGMPVKKGGLIAVLHHEMAELTAARPAPGQGDTPKRRPRPSTSWPSPRWPETGD